MNLSAWLNAKSTRTVGTSEANSTGVSVYELGGRLQVKILSRSPIFGALRQLNRKADDMRRIEGNTFRTVRCKMRPAPSNLPSLFRIRRRLFSAFTSPWRLEQGGFHFHAAPRRVVGKMGNSTSDGSSIRKEPAA